MYYVIVSCGQLSNVLRLAGLTLLASSILNSEDVYPTTVVFFTY